MEKKVSLRFELDPDTSLYKKLCQFAKKEHMPLAAAVSSLLAEALEIYDDIYNFEHSVAAKEK